MYQFYQNTEKWTYFEITLDEKDFSIKTKSGDFRSYHRNNNDKESSKSYKKLETAQRNFEKRCQEKKDKGFRLSDPFAPLAFKAQIDKVKEGKSTILQVDIYHEKNFDEIFQLKSITALIINGLYKIPIPDSIAQLENLAHLSISNNISDIPKSIDQLKKLQSISISSCPDIIALPDSISKCKNLEIISIDSSSNIKSLPGNIGKLKKLKELFFEHSQLASLPPSIGQCESLEKINGGFCKTIHTLPKELGQLKNLKRLDFRYAGLSTIPDCITEIKSLEEIDFSQTNLKSLPENIGNLRNLKKLSLSMKLTPLKGISQLPASFFNLTNLEEIDLSNNQLSEVPRDFQKLTKLHTLNLNNNPIENVPGKIINKGYKAIFQHLGWLVENEDFLTQSALSNSEKATLVKQYKERFDRFYKKHNPNDWKPAFIDEIMAYLKFESDCIPHFKHGISRYRNSALAYLWTLFSPIDEWTEVDHRVMKMLTKNGWNKKGWRAPFFTWYIHLIESKNEPDYQAIIDILNKHEQGDTAFKTILLFCNKYLLKDEKPTKLGLAILKRFKKDPKTFLYSIRKMHDQYNTALGELVIQLLILHARKEFEPFVDDWFFYKYPKKDGSVYYFFSIFNISQLCEPNPNKHKDFLLKVHQLNTKPIITAQLGIFFQVFYGDKHKELILADLTNKDLFLANIRDNKKFNNFYNPAYDETILSYFDWMTTLYKEEVKDLVFQSFQKEAKLYIKYLGVFIKNYGQETLPIFKILLENKHSLDKVIPHLKEYDYSTIHDQLWEILKSDHQKQRTLAVNELVRLYQPKGLLKELPDLLYAKKVGDRVGPLELLIAIDDKSTSKLLKERFKEEQDSALRNMIVLQLQRLGEDIFLQKEILSGFEWAKANKKLNKPVKKWLDESVLPPLHWKNGKKAEAELARYLFFRQKDVTQGWHAPSPEVKLILNEVDTTKGGDFAAKLLALTLEKDGLKATSKAVVGIISALGDDQLIEPLKAYTIQRNNVVAPQMLGHIISEKAARALDGIMLHYKTKYPNVTGAAQSGFDNIAEEMSLTRFELMDKMIPDFGFVDMFKTFEVNGATWRAFINEDLKLSYINDMDEIKKSLPTKTPKEIKAEVTELNKEIRSIAKNQKSSLEFNLIAQRRWPTADWQAHFMSKPLTFALAQTLVWGVYKEEKLMELFNVNQDQTLQNIEFDEIELPKKASIGLVHPIDMNKDQLKAWQAFLYDEEITPPFEQINRKVISVAKEQEKLTVIEQYKGKEVSDYRFRSVMGKRGWKRGSVVDGGMVANYKKTYEAFGIDVFVNVEEMYIHLGEYSENINLQNIYFVKTNSVKTGSYVYDTYKNDEDERLFKLKDLPPLVYSETMYDIEVLLKK